MATFSFQHKTKDYNFCTIEAKTRKKAWEFFVSMEIRRLGFATKELLQKQGVVCVKQS